MDKGRLVIEVEKDGDMLREADVKISNLTLGEISAAVGAVINDSISKGTDDKTEQVFWKVCALRDICLQLELASVADRLDGILGRLGCGENEQVDNTTYGDSGSDGNMRIRQ